MIKLSIGSYLCPQIMFCEFLYQVGLLENLGHKPLPDRIESVSRTVRLDMRLSTVGMKEPN
jgi:hypothetical protein